MRKQPDTASAHNHIIMNFSEKEKVILSGFFLFLNRLSQETHVFCNFRLISIFRRMIEAPALHSIRKILLLYIMIRIIVSIPITDSMSQFCGTAVMRILQMYRNRHGTLVFHCIHRLKYRIACGIGFWSRCHIKYCLRQNDLGLRHADALHSLGRTDCHRKGLRVCIAHIFRPHRS